MLYDKALQEKILYYLKAKKEEKTLTIEINAIDSKITELQKHRKFLNNQRGGVRTSQTRFLKSLKPIVITPEELLKQIEKEYHL